MAQKVLTKKTFVGQGAAGHLAYPGEIVDVDEKGEVIPAPSTPIGHMSPDQIEAYLRAAQERSKAKGPDYGANVADPRSDNTGAQALAIAPVAPHAPGATQPQVLPPGTVPVGDRFLRPAPAGADAAVEEVVANTSEQIEAVDGAQAGDAAIDGTVPEVTERINQADAAELDQIEAAEKDREVPRKGVQKAIDARRAQLSEG